MEAEAEAEAVEEDLPLSKLLLNRVELRLELILDLKLEEASVKDEDPKRDILFICLLFMV